MKDKRLECFTSLNIYAILSSEHSRGRSNVDVARQMLESGIKIIQYREKDFSMKRKYQECLELRALTTGYNAVFIINDDVHLALAVNADGVHLGQDDLPIHKAREILGENYIIGLSTHSPDQADEAVRLNVDYIGVGPIYLTRTKKDVCQPVGIRYLDYVVENITMPFVAIGGIKEHNVHEVSAHGARCICLVTEIVGADDIGRKIESVRKSLNSGIEDFRM